MMCRIYNYIEGRSHILYKGSAKKIIEIKERFYNTINTKNVDHLTPGDSVPVYKSNNRQNDETIQINICL